MNRRDAEHAEKGAEVDGVVVSGQVWVAAGRVVWLLSVKWWVRKRHG